MTLTDFSASIHVHLGKRSYDIVFDALSSLPRRLAQVGLSRGLCLVVTDENVARLYADRLMEGLQSDGWTPIPITLPFGETTKSIANLNKIYDVALAHRIERTTPLLAVGGGVVGDLGGFAAATLLRGLPLIQIPTTLIAQVDSSIGGKTGINHAQGKNLLGAFYQPRLVLSDTSTLETLPDREWTSGLAEVVKHALIADAQFFAGLESRWGDVLRRKDYSVPALVRKAAGVKAGIVEKDEREAGRRAILNFGHTFAHAIERVAGYGTFTHGEAVAAGMTAALHLSHSLHPALDFDRASRLVAQIPVPPGLQGLDLGALIHAMTADKKVEGGRLRFVILEEIGRAAIVDDVDASAIEAAWKFARQDAG